MRRSSRFIVVKSFRHFSGFHQGNKFGAVQRLIPQECFRQLIQPFQILRQDLFGLVVTSGQHFSDFPVDLCSNFFAVFTALSEFHTDKDFLVASQVDRADIFTHAELRHHLAADFCRTLQVTGGAGVDLSKRNFLRCMSAQHHRDLVQQLGPAHVVMFLSRKRQRMSGRLSPRNDRDQVHFVAAFQHMSDDRMTAFMAGDHPAVFFIDLVALLLRAHLYPCDRVDQQLLVDLLLPGARSQDGRFIHHIFEVRARRVRHPLGDVVQVDVIRQRLSLAVYLQDRNAPVLVRIIDGHLAVKTAGPHQCRIEDIPAVCRGHHDDTFIHGESVHLDQQLVQRLFALIMPAAKSGAAMAAHCVNLIDENDRRSNLLGLFKQIPDAAGADADKHLNEVAAADGEERYTCFSGNGFGQQGFSGSGRSDEQYALRNPGAQFRIHLWILQEVNHFLKLFLLFVRARNISKSDLVAARILHARTAFSEGHDLSAAARLGADHHEPDYRHDTEHDQVWQEIIPPGNHDRGTVFDRKRQFVYRDLVDRYSLRVGFDLADRVEEILSDGRFKVVTAFRKILLRYDRGFGDADKGIVPDGNPADLAVLDHFQQSGIFDSPVHRLVQPAVQQDSNQQQRCQQNNITGDSPGWFSIQKRFLLQLPIHSSFS